MSNTDSLILKFVSTSCDAILIVYFSLVIFCSLSPPSVSPPGSPSTSSLSSSLITLTNMSLEPIGFSSAFINSFSLIILSTFPSAPYSTLISNSSFAS